MAEITIDITEEEVSYLAHASGSLHGAFRADKEHKNEITSAMLGVPNDLQISKMIWGIAMKICAANGEATHPFPGDEIENANH